VGNEDDDAESTTDEKKPSSIVATSTKAILAALGLIATTVTSVAAAIYVVAPTLQPREALGAAIDTLTVTQSVSYAEYRLETGLEPSPDSKDPAADGLVVYAHANLQGFKDRSYTLSLQLYESDTRRQIHVGAGEPYFSSCDNRSPRAKEEGLTWTCWIVSPKPGVKYFVRTFLYDSGKTTENTSGPVTYRGELLAFLDGPNLTASK
jgi:hypothetical protein